VQLDLERGDHLAAAAEHRNRDRGLAGHQLTVRRTTPSARCRRSGVCKVCGV
jgi:hypothetical protein